MSDKKIIVWFRSDLRLADNPALHAAAQQGKILPVYILDEYEAGDFKMGFASRWWLHHSLKDLSQSLDGALQIYQGHALSILKKLIKETAAEALYFNRCYEPWAIQRDAHITKQLIEHGVEIETFNASLLWEPQDIIKNDGTSYKVFSAFFKSACLSDHGPRAVVPAPKSIQLVKIKHTTTINDLELLQKDVDSDRFKDYWVPGEKNAMKRLKYFIEDCLENYKVGRDFPAQESVSRLSPYLRFGEISPNQIWSMIQDIGYDFATRENVQHFLKELGWREFSYNVLFYKPSMPRLNLQPKFNHFEWRYDESDLKAWQMGRTGYPLVDAAMRELWNTGYMHNRMRMVVASFLIKNLMIHWHKGEDWFWHLLVDADLASNSFNWQWVAGCGYDAAPFFRIFNPTLQGKKFDAKGAYTRHWVPELSKLPDKYLFEPWKASELVLTQAGIALGDTYPNKIVEISASRVRALKSFKKL